MSTVLLLSAICWLSLRGGRWLAAWSDRGDLLGGLRRKEAERAALGRATDRANAARWEMEGR